MKRTLGILMLCLALSGIDAQGQNANVDSLNIFVVNAPDVSVATPKRNSELPMVKDTVPPPPSLKYHFLHRQFPTDIQLDTIKSAKIKGLPLSPLERGYLKAGFGNYFTTYADVYVNSLRSRKHALGARLNHYASQAELNNLGYGGYSDNSLNLYGRKFLKTHIVKADVEANRNVLHYYGYDPDNVPELFRDTTKQTFFGFGGNIKLKSFLKDSSDLNHEVGIGYYNLSDSYDASENNVKLKAKVHKYYENELLSLETGVDYNSLNRAIATDTVSTIIHLKPSLQSGGKNWSLTLGLNAMIDHRKNDARFHFYPDAHFSYKIVPDVLTPYAGVTGGVQRNNLNSLSRENPFIATQWIALDNSNEKYRLYGGIRGAFSSRSSFNIQAKQYRVENLPLFVNDTNFSSEPVQFVALYDTVNVVNLSAEASYRKSDKMEVLLKGEYFIYDLENEFEAWHKPEWKATISGRYNLQNKILVRADFFFLAGQIARTFDPEDDKSYGNGVFGRSLSGTVDLNLEGEYNLNNRIWVFLRLNNVAASRYRRWNGYPTQGFTVLAGASYSFWGK